VPIDHYTARENFERYCYARDGGHLEYLKKAEKCDQFFAGLQWQETIRRRLERQGKPVLTINETFASMASIMGEQLQNRSDVSFRPKNRGTQQTADALTKLWLHFASHYKLDWLESEVAADGFITSRGFYDVRLDFDENMRGEAIISLLNPKNVIIDCDGEDYDPDKWKEVFLSKWFSVSDIARLYDEDDAEELKNMPRSAFEFGYDSIDYATGSRRDTFDGNDNWARSMAEDEDDPVRRRIRVIERQYRELKRVLHFADKVTGETRMVPPDWDKERVERVAFNADLALIKRQSEVIHWTVSADSVVLHDAISPLRHFTPVPYFPFFRRGTTIGLVEHILSPQEMLNKTLSQELHVVNTTANSGYKVKKGALQNMDTEELEERGAETGIVIELDDIQNIEKIQPNTVPTGLDRLTFKAQEFAKRVMNVPDTLRGFDREDVAAKAIAQKKVNSSNSFAKPLDNLNRTRHMLARNVIDLVQVYYTEERTFQITGRDLKAQAETLVINGMDEAGVPLNDLTIGEYETVVTTVPPRDTFQQQQFAEVMQMRQLGIGIPDDIVVETSTLERKAEIVNRMRGGDSAEQQAELAALQREITLLDQQLKKADILKKTADARLAEARARQTMAEAGQGDFDSEILIQRERMVKELELKQREIEGNLALKERELDAKLEMMNKEHALNVAKADADAEREDMRVDSQERRSDFQAREGEEREHKRVSLDERRAQRDLQRKDRESKVKEKVTVADAKRKEKVDQGNLKLKEKQLKMKSKEKPSGKAKAR
jgi:hypothetical protein